MRDYLNEQAKTRFLFPIDGDYLNDRDGTPKNGEIEVTVTVASAPDCKVIVNGVPASRRLRILYDPRAVLLQGL